MFTQPQGFRVNPDIVFLPQCRNIVQLESHTQVVHANPARKGSRNRITQREVTDFDKIRRSYKNIPSLINQILKLRLQKAKLFGFNNYAEYQTDAVMAKTVKNAEDLLMKIWKPAVKKSYEEIADMQKYADAHGGNFKIAGWDYYYYAEKVKKEKFNFDETEVRPYFPIENVRKGIFTMANKLYGITFKKVEGAPVYHPDVDVYEVLDSEGKHLATFMSDYYTRAGKRQGAWMFVFQEANGTNGNRPIVYNVGNFTKPAAGSPSLLTIDELDHVDLAIDGVDEIDPQFNAIKGGGGALYREKVVASMAKEVIWIMDESKLVDKIGAFHLPVEIAQYGSKQAMERMAAYGFNPVLRVRDGKTFVTDNGNFIADLHLGAGFDIQDVYGKLTGMLGVLEHGLFLNMCKRMIVGCSSGEVKIIENPSK